jgi:hypothetical protein
MINIIARIVEIFQKNQQQGKTIVYDNVMIIFWILSIHFADVIFWILVAPWDKWLHNKYYMHNIWWWG